MKGKPRTAKGIASLLVPVVALIAVMALALPALAKNGHGDRFGDRDPAGTIASFDATTKVLTVDLANGGSVSGLVTRWTWIGDDDRCDRHGRDHRRQLHGDDCRRHLSGSGGDHGDHHWPGRGDSDDLVPGAVVEDAVLGLADGRAFFVKVDLDD